MSGVPSAARSLCVASPIYNDQCYGSYAHALLALQAALFRREIGMEYAWTRSSSLITIARNLLADWFLQRTACSHLLFVDADMVFRSEDVLRMLDADLDVIAAICPRKAIHWDNVASAARQHPSLDAAALALAGASYGTFELLDPAAGLPLDRPVEVTGIGTGIMLIKREVLLRLREAHPQATAPVPGERRRMHSFFELERDEHGNPLSEDISFCRRWRAIGGKVHGAPWFEVGHLGTHEFRGNLRQLAELGSAV